MSSERERMFSPEHVIAVTSARHVPDDAVRWGSALARRLSVPLMITDVVDDGSVQRRAEELDRIRGRLDQSVTVRCHVAEGSTPDAVLRTADQFESSIIVLPPDGRRSEPTAPWGSFAASLAAAGVHPVIRLKTAATTQPRRILALLEAPTSVRQTAQQLATTLDSRLHLLAPHSAESDVRRMLRDGALRHLDIRVEMVTSIDAGAIRDASRRTRADILVLPSEGLDPETAALVRQTDFTVLTVPATAVTPAIAA